MTQKEKEEIAKRIADLEKEGNNANIFKEIPELVKNCSIGDLADIDEIITSKYLTD